MINLRQKSIILKIFPLPDILLIPTVWRRFMAKTEDKKKETKKKPLKTPKEKKQEKLEKKNKKD